MTIRKQDGHGDPPPWITGAPTWVKVAMGVAAGAAACQLLHALRSGRARFSMTSSPAPQKQGPSRITFTEVGGHDELKRQIERRIITPFREPRLFERYKKRAGGGILMYGPPGCGKTLIARATAGQCNARFINVAISDVLDKWLGESEQKLSAIFADARARTPSVLFFDELDGLAATQHRESTHSGIVSQLLTEMDGFSRGNQGMLVLAATNVPWSIDPAFRRPGRFDRVLFVPPPDRTARLAILRIQLSGRPTAGDLGLETIAERTEGYSGADLELLVEQAVDAAIDAALSSRVEVPVRAQHLQAALSQTKATTLPWLTMAREHAHCWNNDAQYSDLHRYLVAHPVK
ncbi:MAG: ATP-binding protein [Myxococcales bacterium]|nr:ATP-binding protein [Myxococcales bacterium]